MGRYQPKSQIKCIHDLSQPIDTSLISFPQLPRCSHHLPAELLKGLEVRDVLLDGPANHPQISGVEGQRWQPRPILGTFLRHLDDVLRLLQKGRSLFKVMVNLINHEYWSTAKVFVLGHDALQDIDDGRQG